MAVPGSLNQERIVEPARELPVAGRSEVLVVGGGPAGVAAALAAARTGARTALVEQYGFLGGMWTAGLLNPILDHHEKGGMVQEIVERLRAVGKVVEGPRANFDTEYMKYMLDRMMAEAGVEMRLYRSAVETICDDAPGGAGKRVCGVVTESKSGREALLAETVIDCTGDGDICARAGVPYTLGREADGLMQSVTLFFMLANVRYMQERHGTDIHDMLARAAQEQGLSADNGRPYDVPYKTPSFFEQPLEGHTIVQLTHMVGCDGTNADDLTRATIEGRQQVQDGVRVMGYVPELAGVELVSTAAQLGVRETRHIEGRYRLQEEDLLSGRRFADGICVVRFNIDIHAVRPAAGTETIHIEGGQVEPYHIPYRALLPVNREHLLMAGRCISGSSVAHASYRVTGDCVAMGQAAGTAAALALREGVPPSKLDPAVLVRQLEADGVRL
jgi:hypothetical protein